MALFLPCQIAAGVTSSTHHTVSSDQSHRRSSSVKNQAPSSSSYTHCKIPCFISSSSPFDAEVASSDDVSFPYNVPAITSSSSSPNQSRRRSSSAKIKISSSSTDGGFPCIISSSPFDIEITSSYEISFPCHFPAVTSSSARSRVTSTDDESHRRSSSANGGLPCITSSPGIPSSCYGCFPYNISTTITCSSSPCFSPFQIKIPSSSHRRLPCRGESHPNLLDSVFHVDDERFSRIELPKELPGVGEPRRISISETKVTGSLTVMYLTSRSYEILVKKGLGSAEDSWVRFCSMVRVDLELIWEDGLTGSLELGEDDELCFYDCKTHEIERLGLPGMGLRNRGAAYAADYTASLVLLEPEFGAVPCSDPVTGYSLIRQDMNFGVM
ncbi:unnamed protein product [Linum tenue]|uniref:Uncharacterized protein n=1 Tax=Linum tenue TaxID=586396 RepID=A0AAV0RHF9_9ROSI|nr:unnamed protein product [Linum tenue]